MQYSNRTNEDTLEITGSARWDRGTYNQVSSIGWVLYHKCQNQQKVPREWPRARVNQSRDLQLTLLVYHYFVLVTEQLDLGNDRVLRQFYDNMLWVPKLSFMHYRTTLPDILAEARSLPPSGVWCVYVELSGWEI